ncbi:MAG: YfhO family protein [Lutibacter sp.]|nr:YfhO family protein [Lutibacter sp.]
MRQFSLNNTAPYLLALVLFVLASLAYFSPVLQGKQLPQSDISQFIGSSKEIVDFRKEYQEEPYWTNTSFIGMPSYVVSAYYPYDFIKQADRLLRFLPRPADYLFLYLLNFFILLLILKVDWKTAITGALAFGFSTYLIIILGVGHNAKAHAIAYMPLVLSGILLVFQRRYFCGFLLTALAMALELSANHIQMTYYLFFLVLILGIVQLSVALRKQEWPHFFKSSLILLVALILSIGVNATGLLATSEYSKYSTRGKSELTIHPDGTEKEVTSGLDRDYITEYSYGRLETFNLFIPRFMGGTRHEVVEDSALRTFLTEQVQQQRLDPTNANYLLQLSSMYWGSQPIVAAPAYVGAVVLFLFVLALFLVKGPMRNWLLAATVFAILMSWGKHLSILTDFFIQYVPLYNKFRAVSSIQVIAELAIPLLAVLGLKALFAADISKGLKLVALKRATLIAGGLALFFSLFGTSLFAFETPVDLQIDAQISGFLDVISHDRKTLFFHDSLRSLLLVCLSAGLLWLFIEKRLSKNILLGGLSLLILFDLVNVDKRYLDNEAFTTARKVRKPFQATAIDKAILKDQDHYRVADFSKNLLADGSTSYFHKSIGGYHAAKPRRYQELFDFHIARGNTRVLDMLNTRYIIGTDESGQRGYEHNDAALGNAWFVNELLVAADANQEIRALDSLPVANKAVINQQSVSAGLQTRYPLDKSATVELVSYRANALEYITNTDSAQFAVFSEMYYKDGWQAYIDGKPSPHYQVNYVLRGLQVPKGTHRIEFKFEPSVIRKGSFLTLLSYGLFFGISLAWFIRNKRKPHVS